MSNFQPPPTWANPVIVDETTGKSIFNPIWLKWFIDLAGGLSAAGAGNVSGYAPAETDHFTKWLDDTARSIGDGGFIGSAAHAAVEDFLAADGTAVDSDALEGHAAAYFLAATAAADFLPVNGTAVDSYLLEGATWESPAAIGTTTPATVHGSTVRATTAGGFEASTGNPGFTGTVTTASLVGKTITIEDGIITGFA